jgi:hypothetical protein
MLKPKKFEDVNPEVLFVEWCAGIEWATAAPADSRDALLNEVVKRAKKLLDGKSGG